MAKYKVSRAKSSLKLNVRQVMARKGITHPFKWMRSHGITPRMATHLLNEQYDKLPMTALSILCEMLWCTPNDLLRWAPTHPDSFSATHPLQSMRPSGGEMSITDRAERLTTTQLNEVAKIMDEMMKTGIEKKD